MQIKTTKLQEMMAKAVRGVGDNKLIPLTSLIALEVKDGVLTITSTDATNYLYITENVEGDDFYVCVQAEQFAKLIARMTSESVNLTVTDNSLEVKGNGTYSIALPLDEDGSMVKYPNPMANIKAEPIGTIGISTVKTILTSIKPALAVKSEFQQYTNYFVGDCVIATDTFNINALDVELISVPMLVSGNMMNLLDVVTDEEISVAADGNKLVMTTSNCTIFGTCTGDVADFSIEAIRTLVEQKFPSSCKLSKVQLLQLLDRISLFVDNFDEGAVTLTFTADGLMVSSKKSSGTELIPYVESINFADFVGIADIISLQTQIKAQTCDVIELQYGLDTAIKLVDDKTTAIIALLTE